MGVFTPPSRYIPPPFGYALGLVPTSSHPLAGEQLDAVPRPLMDDSPGRLSAITSVQPISTSIPSAPALGSPFQFKFGEKRPISRKRPSHLEGRAGKYKGTERLPISEESMVEKTRVVEQQALATRQIINQKSAEVEAQVCLKMPCICKLTSTYIGRENTLHRTGRTGDEIVAWTEGGTDHWIRGPGTAICALETI